MVSDNTMVQVENLTKRFGKVRAIDNISFEVERGEIVGFLGPNGAGKTTTMRILACYLAATGGDVRIGGFDVFHDSVEVRRKIGYLPENVPLYHDMRVNEYLEFRGHLKGLKGKRLRERMDEVIDCCGLQEERRSIIGRLSKGFRQRVGLADSLVHEPEVLILDEPTIGLDPNQIRHIRNLIKSLAQRHTVLLSTHILSEVEMICERVMIISKGRIVAADTTGNLVGLMKGNVRVIAEVKGPVPAIVEKIEGLAGIVKVACEDGVEWTRLACECEKGVDVRDGVFRTVVENGGLLRELKAEKKRLEDVFVEITTQEEDE